MARVFNANAANYIDVGTSSSLSPANMTISAWLIYTGAAQAQALARDDNTLGRSFAFGMLNSSTFNFQAGTSNTIQKAMSSNVWHHVAVAGPGAAWLGYIDNVLTTGINANAIGAATGSTTIGKRTYSGFNNPWSGSIAHMAMWNVVLTAGEISGLSRGQLPYMVRPKSLVAYWPLDGLSSPEPDLSGNQFNGTINGTVTAGNGPPVAMFTPRWPSNVEPSAAASNRRRMLMGIGQ